MDSVLGRQGGFAGEASFSNETAKLPSVASNFD